MNWQYCLAGSSKTAPRILIFSIVIGANYSFQLISIETYAPQYNGHDKIFLGSVKNFYWQVIDQDQWEEWLLALMDDTLAEVDLDEWNNAFVGAMTKQLTTLYTEKDVKGKDEAFKIITKVRLIFQYFRLTAVEKY